MKTPQVSISDLCISDCEKRITLRYFNIRAVKSHMKFSFEIIN